MAVCRYLYLKIEAIIALFFILLIYLYRMSLSPLLGTRCRFYPSCSQYALDAIKSHGLPIGLWLMMKRLLKCHPGTSGGFDPVPERQTKKKIWCQGKMEPKQKIRT